MRSPKLATPVVIGGSGYRWRGKAIRTIRKNNNTCVTMPRKDSMIMAPCVINGGKQYKVVITASRNSGNGAILIDFFGGKFYGGQQVPVNIVKPEMYTYTVVVTAPNFPKSLPMYLRVWRPNDAVGNVFVRSIRYELLKKPLNAKKVSPPKKAAPSKDLSERRRIEGAKGSPKDSEIYLQRRKERIKQKLQEKKLKRHKLHLPTIGNPKENKIMKFKPYNPKTPTDMVAKVLVRNPEDVPKVSIITPTRDGAALLKKCFEALNKNTCYPNWEWIIGDSNSTDGAAAQVKSWKDPRIKLVERGTTEGSFSSINNELAKYATGDYLLFLNDDTEPQQFWLYEMMSKIHRHPKIGIVGARLMYSAEKIQHAGIAFIPQGPANIGKSVLKSFPKGFAKQDRFYQAVTGACLLMRASDFKAVKGFDPIYYFCYEDVDLCLKVRYTLNKKVLYAANAVVHHAESVTQKVHKTAGAKQQAGIKVFKERWMNKVSKDFSGYQNNKDKGVNPVDISFVTCVNDMAQYRSYVIGSLFKTKSNKNYEIIPILNFGNPYSAAHALNIGIGRARSDIVVLCHQDVLFYEQWIDMLFDRIKEVENRTKKWGVLGTAGISRRDDTVGVVHNMKGRLQWQSSKRSKVYPVQTVDEHCMIIRKSSGLRFDQVIFNGFHFYGPDLCLNAASKGFMNFGILCPLVHDSRSGSLISGKREFMRLLNALAKKWRPRFPHIRTPTSIVRKRSVRTFVRFRKN
jgi:GT2 family glycosyltransferase